MRHSGELAAFVHAEPLLDGRRFAEIPHRDNVQTLPQHLSAVVEQYEARYVPNMKRVLPVSIPHPNVLDPAYVSSHALLQGAHCRIERQPVAIRCMRLEGLRMNLVDHDVDVKVLLVIVRDNHELMVLVSECLQRVQRAICPLRLRVDVLPAAMPVHNDKAHPCSVGSKMQSPPFEPPPCPNLQGCPTIPRLPAKEAPSVGVAFRCQVLAQSPETARNVAERVALWRSCYSAVFLLKVASAVCSSNSTELSCTDVVPPRWEGSLSPSADAFAIQTAC
jgi:hypothetical protein